MLGEERYSEDGEGIWLYEETIHDLVLETWSAAFSTLSEEDFYALGLEQTTSELFDQRFHHDNVLNSTCSHEGNDRDTLRFESASQVSSNSPEAQDFVSGGDSGNQFLDSRGESGLDTNLNLSSSTSQVLHFPSEIYEQFSRLDTVQRTPGSLSEHRRTFPEVRLPLDLAEDLDVTSFLERWGRGQICWLSSFTGINLEAVQALKRAIRPLRVAARDAAACLYDRQGIDWHALGVTRAQAQDTRKWWYKR